MLPFPPLITLRQPWLILKATGRVRRRRLENRLFREEVTTRIDATARICTTERFCGKREQLLVDGRKSCRSKSMPHSSLSRTSSGLASICPITAWQTRRDHYNCASSNVMSPFEQFQHILESNPDFGKGDASTSISACVSRSPHHGIQITFVQSWSDQAIIYSTAGLFGIEQIAIESRML